MMVTSDMQVALLRLIDEMRALVEKKAEDAPAPKVFKVGQLVRRVTRTHGGPPVGRIGIIRCMDSSSTHTSFGVEWANLEDWDDDMPHTLKKTLLSKCGWYVPPTDLELCNPGEA